MIRRYAFTLGCTVVVLLSHCARDERRALATRTPVIIVSIDTLRADHLSIYGYRGVETPNLAAFAGDAIVFENAYSPCPLTLPSHVAMLSGVLPAENGVRNNLGYRFDGQRAATIPMLLKKQGYSTGAAVSAYVLRGNTGLRDAFDFYDDAIGFESGASLGNLQRPGGMTIAAAEKWISAHSSQPLFFFLHLFEPHSPYDPPEPYRTRYADRPYDGEIAAADDLFGQFIRFLREKKIYDRAAIIVMSDHGEGLGDHGEQEHGIFLYREAIHVPLLLKLPAAQSGGTRVAAPVQLIDILPTVASLTGMAVPDGAKGTSLIDLARRPVVRRIFSETMYPRLHLGLSDLRSLVDDRFHFIEAPRPELYRLPDDPAEKHNVISEDRRVYAEMKQGIAAFDGRLQAPSGITSEEAQKLAALGYIGSATASTAVSTRDPKDFISSVEAMKAAHSIDDLQTVVRKNPEYTDAWAELAKALERAGRFEEAASAYQRTLALVPTMTEETALSLASVYLNLNRLDEAKKHAALALRSNAGAAHLLLGRVALAQKDYAGAEQQARLAEADEHYRLQGGVLLAQTLTKTNRMPEALTLINSVQQEIEQKHLRPLLLLHFARGDALARLGRIAEAQEAFREEIRLFPHDRQTYAHLAALYLLQGRRRDADQTIDQLIANNRDRERYRLAYETYSRLGDAAAAEVWRSRLKRLESDQQR